MRISSKEWAILFPNVAPGARIDRSTLTAAIDRAQSERSLPPDRIAALRREIATAFPSTTHRASQWLDIQVGGTADVSPATRRVQRFLDGVDLIRVTTENGSSFGHQHAAISAIRELRELGYRGTIELIVPEGAEHKMATLLSGTGDLGVRTIQERDFDRSKAPHAIGIVAASDHDERSFLDHLGVDACIVLQPYDWPGERRLEIRGKEIEPLDLPSSSTYVYEVTDPLKDVEPLLPLQMNALAEFVANAMAGQPPEIAAKADGILALFRAVLSGRVDLMPAYGLHHRAVDERRETVIGNLVSGIRAFQERQGTNAKPAVLLEIGPRETGDLARPSLNTELRTAKKNNVIHLSAGALPRPIFELLYKYATMPALFEGANTSNLVQLLGKPFLSVFSEITGLPSAPGVEHVDQISSGLRREEAEEQVGRLQKLLTMFAGMKQQLPREVYGPLAARIQRGEALSDGETARMKANVLAHLAKARPDYARGQLEGFAEMIASSMQQLSRALSELRSLPSSVRRAIAEFDTTHPEAHARAGAIIDACHGAIARMIADRFAELVEMSRDPSSPVAAYFQRAHENALAPENRQLVRGIDRMREALEGGKS